MSYIRFNSPLRFVKGVSSAYVFPTYRKSNSDEDDPETFIEDYNNKYEDKNTLLDLVCRIVQHETDDEKFTMRIAKALAKHMKIEKFLRDKPLTTEDWSKETKAI